MQKKNNSKRSLIKAISSLMINNIILYSWGWSNGGGGTCGRRGDIIIIIISHCNNYFEVAPMRISRTK